MGSQHPTARRRILIVDDSNDDVLLFRRALRRAQVPWTISGFLTNGEEAIHYLERICQEKDETRFPDVLFLDLELPRKKGFEVLAWVRNHLPKRTMKVIVTSNSSLPIEQARARELGADDYIIKAGEFMDHVDLLLRIERSLADGTL